MSKLATFAVSLGALVLAFVTLSPNSAEAGWRRGWGCGRAVARLPRLAPGPRPGQALASPGPGPGPGPGPANHILLPMLFLRLCCTSQRRLNEDHRSQLFFR